MLWVRVGSNGQMIVTKGAPAGSVVVMEEPNSEPSPALIPATPLEKAALRWGSSGLIKGEKA